MVLAITYDEFEFPEVNRAVDVRLQHHLRRIIRYCLVGILLTLAEDTSAQARLSRQDKQLLLQLAAEHLAGLGEIEFEKTIRSLKSLTERFKDKWNEWLPISGALGNMLLSILKRIGPFLWITSAPCQASRTFEYSRSESLKHQLRIVAQLAQRIGYKSVYILVDRVDEAELTGNNVNATFRLLEPLLKDLQLLETEGIGFKFFLWDMLRPLCDQIVRTDRIDQETLYWQDELLRQMWNTRLSAFSDNRIGSLVQVSEPTHPFTVDELAFISRITHLAILCGSDPRS